MSGRGVDEPRAKRRRCAPKRYAEEDDSLPADDSAGKPSPESSNEQQQQQQQQQDAACPDQLSWPGSCHTQMQPVETEDDQALRIIQQLAVKLEKEGRPCLRDLFCQSSRHSTLIRPIRSPLMTKDVTEAAALLVSFGC